MSHYSDVESKSKEEKDNNFYVISHFVFSCGCTDSLAIYKAAYPFGGYMSDVIAAVDQVWRSHCLLKATMFDL